MSTANRVIAHIATLHAPAGLAGSAFMTATIVNLTAEELRVPFYFVQYGTSSAGPEVEVFRSTDGGANFDTIAAPSFSVSRSGGTQDRKTIVLDGGIYAFKMCAGGPYTCTVGVNTVEVLTAYEAV